jgi:glutamate formiminotransferase/formiminotetrahydrofolate cyclodeaminase
MQLVECVPNISEGRDEAIIAKIAQTILDIDDVFLLDKDIGRDVNRTVLTFAGSPAAVSEAAFNLIAKTSELIDMRIHRGSHPRIGATDVCPIIPLINTRMTECVELSKNLAQRVGSELAIPVYLYGESALSSQRKSLAHIRSGQYENLFLRIDELIFKPDFGPVVCARKILIAFNIHLNTTDLTVAKTIARTIRQLRQSHQKMDIDSNRIVEQKQFKPTWQEVQAIGWYVDEYKCCQISLNLLDYKKTSLHEAFLGVSKLASEQGISVAGSEIIGLVPLQALLAVGNYVSKNNGKDKHTSLNEDELLTSAIKFLKLDSFHPFVSQEKVLEYKLEQLGITATRI